MGRPTDEKKGKTVKLRISEELYEEVIKKGSNVSETIRRMIRESLNVPQKEKGAEINVPQNSGKTEIGDTHTESEIEKRLKMYGAPFGLTGEELGNRLLDGMDSGQIMMEGGGFSAKNEYDFDRFVEACRMKGVDVEKMLEKCTQMIKGM